jgi:hypothetical protein
MEPKKTRQKENDITNGKVFKAKYGTCDEEIPKVLYLNVKTKVQPIQQKTTYASDVRNVKKLFGEYINGYFAKTDKFSNKFIYSCDVSENNMKFGRKSNVKYEVILKPTEIRKFDEYSDDMRELSETLSNELYRIMDGNEFEIG